MLVNVTQLRIEADERFIRFYPVNEEMMRGAEEQGKEWLGHPRHLVLTHEEAEMAIECLRGKAPFYPFFDDGIHLIKFHPHGFREAYNNGRLWDDYWFIIPGEWLAEKIEEALGYTYTLEEPWLYELQPETIKEFKEQYGPEIAWDHAEGVYEKLCIDLSDDRCTRLQGALDCLEAIAKNHSDGEVVTIGLRFDMMRPEEGIPASYYFWITQPDGRRIINGGIIAHRDRRYEDDEDGIAVAVMLDSWEYGTHT